METFLTRLRDYKLADELGAALDDYIELIDWLGMEKGAVKKMFYENAEIVEGNVTVSLLVLNSEFVVLGMNRLSFDGRSSFGVRLFATHLERSEIELENDISVGEHVIPSHVSTLEVLLGECTSITWKENAVMRWYVALWEVSGYGCIYYKWTA